jgi:hypothetical protein
MLEQQRTFTHDDLADGFDAVALAAAIPARTAAPVQPEGVDLEMPAWIWGSMAVCYGIFFAGLIAATGHDGEALFALVISIGYALMYFGSAAALFSVAPPRRRSAFARGVGPLKTWTGPMDTAAVAAQVLTVPACLAFFGLAVAAIRAVIMG